MAGTVVAVLILVVAIVLAMPLFRKAVNEIGGLPLSYSAVIRQQAADKHLDPALVARLGAAAGGTDNIADFCTALLTATPGPSATPAAPPDGKPDHPEKTKAKPSKKPKH